MRMVRYSCARKTATTSKDGSKLPYIGGILAFCGEPFLETFMLRILLASIALMSGFAIAQDEPPAKLLPADEDAALRVAELVGALLYQHDRAAAVATDALAKVRGYKRNKGLEGWITEAQGDSIVVTFVGRDKEGSRAVLYRVHVDGNGRIVGKAAALKVPEPLSEFEAAAAEARALAIRSPFQQCAEKYNSVVLPSGVSKDEWVVYLLPGTTKRNIVPLGGSYRVDANIRTGVANLRAYTKTCVQLQNDPGAVGLMVTHLLDPTPTDVHVFWSIWAGKPIYVATPPHGTLWSVDGPEIRLVKRRDEG